MAPTKFATVEMVGPSGRIIVNAHDVDIHTRRGYSLLQTQPMPANWESPDVNDGNRHFWQQLPQEKRETIYHQVQAGTYSWEGNQGDQGDQGDQTMIGEAHPDSPGEASPMSEVAEASPAVKE